MDGSLDKGSSYDCFHTISHTLTNLISKKQQENRLLLKKVMEKLGFTNYSKEWWHYNFRKSKVKKSFFDFDVK